MMHKLVIPARLTGLDVERYHGAGEQIVALSHFAPRLGNSISWSEVDHSQLRIHRTLLPNSTSPEFPRIVVPRPSFTAGLTRSWNRKKVPYLLAILGV